MRRAPARAPISASSRTTATSGPVESLISAAGAANVAAARTKASSRRGVAFSARFEQPEAGEDRAQEAQLEQRQDGDAGERGDAGEEQGQPAAERPDQADAEGDVDQRQVDEREDGLIRRPDQFRLQEAERAVGEDDVLAPVEALRDAHREARVPARVEADPGRVHPHPPAEQRHDQAGPDRHPVRPRHRAEATGGKRGS